MSDGEEQGEVLGYRRVDPVEVAAARERRRMAVKKWLTPWKVGVGVAMVLVAVVVVVIWLDGRGRGEPPWRVMCASHLRQIGTACLIYANGHGGAFPGSMADVFSEDIGPDAVLCPDRHKKLPTTYPSSWYDTGGDYVYHGAGLRVGVPSAVVVAYDKSGAHFGDGCNVLFADGHVEFVTREEMWKVLDDSLVAREKWEGK